MEKLWYYSRLYLLLHAKSDKMLRFISFGSGSCGNCYYLFTDTEGLLIDAGIGIRTLKKYFHDYGRSIADVGNILVTHDHADHVKSVGYLSQDYGIPVYATDDVHRGIAENYCVRKKVPSCNVRFICKGTPFSLGQFSITPFNVPHDSRDNVGYKIVCEGITFCLITDAGHVTEEMAGNISEADYLVIEANHDVEMLLNGAYPPYLKRRVSGPDGHLSNVACAEAVAANSTSRLKHVWLCHLSQENNHPELARKTVEMVFEERGFKPRDSFMLEVLKRKNPTGVFELG